MPGAPVNANVLPWPAAMLALQVALRLPELVEEAVLDDVELVVVQVDPVVAAVRADVAHLDRTVLAEAPLNTGGEGVGRRHLQVRIERVDRVADHRPQRIRGRVGDRRRTEPRGLSKQQRRRAEQVVAGVAAGVDDDARVRAEAGDVVARGRDGCRRGCNPHGRRSPLHP